MIENKKVFIYTLSDDTGVRYIGKTTDINNRKRKHINEARADKVNNHRVNWIKSLLINNKEPKIEIIDEVSFDCWEFWEIFWINQFKVWGFNLTNSTNGGENPPSWRGKTHTKEHRNTLKNRMESSLNPSRGGLSIKWKENISISHKKNGVRPSKEVIELSKKPVIQYDMEGNFIHEWDSITSASVFFKLKSTSGIGMVCMGKRFKAGGFRWSYKGEELKGLKKIKGKSIKQYSLAGNLIKTWESISEASIFLNIDGSQISKSCKDFSKSAGKFKWAYNFI